MRWFKRAFLVIVLFMISGLSVGDWYPDLDVYAGPDKQRNNVYPSCAIDATVSGGSENPENYSYSWTDNYDNQRCSPNNVEDPTFTAPSNWEGNITCTLTVTDAPAQMQDSDPMVAHCDRKPPVTSASSPDYANSSASISMSGTDYGWGGIKYVELHYKYNTTEVDWTKFGTASSSPYEVNFTFPDGEGTYYFASRGRDGAEYPPNSGNGNLESPPGSPDCNTIYDTTPPTISSLSSPTYSQTSPISVSYFSSDNLSGIYRVYLYFKHHDWSTFHYDGPSYKTTASGTFSFDPDAEYANDEGTYQFKVKVYDNAQNYAFSYVDSTIYDHTVGTHSSSPAYISTQEVDVDWELDGSDPNYSGLYEVYLWVKYDCPTCEWEGSGLSPQSGTSGTFTYSMDSPGTYYFATGAEDNAGNVESSPTGTGDSTTVWDVSDPTFGGITDVSPEGDNTVLSWNPASDSSPVHYNIYIATTPGGQNFSTPDYTTENSTGYTIPGLSKTVTRYFVVRAEDAAENEENNTVEKILYTGSVTINNGATETNIRSVTLQLSFSGSPGPQMYIYEDVVEESGKTLEWISYSSSIDIGLSDNDGTKVVKVKFRDSNGNKSWPRSDDIQLNRGQWQGTVWAEAGEDDTIYAGESTLLTGSYGGGWSA